MSLFEISQYITEAATIYVVYIHICVSSKKAINLGCNAVITLKHKYDLNADKRLKKRKEKREKKKSVDVVRVKQAHLGEQHAVTGAFIT